MSKIKPPVPVPTADNSVDSFKNNFYNQLGVHKNSKFQVKFYNVPAMDSPSPQADGEMYQPEVVSFPGRTVNFLSIATAHSYPISVPKSLGYDFSLGMTFPLSTRAKELYFFEEWMDLLIDSQRHLVDYYDDTVSNCTAVLTLFGDKETALARAGQKDVQIAFYGIFPAAIQPIDFSAGNANQYSKISVLFKFFKYNVT
jgi:hypothetical protein